MGDIRDQPTPSESPEPAEPTDSTTATAGSPPAITSQYLGQTVSESATMYRPVGVQQQQQQQQQQHHQQYQQQQQHYSNGPHGFSAQLETPSQHGLSRAGLFNMGTMASALPHVSYRPPPYSPGQQPSYNSLAGPSSNMANQMGMAPYGSQGNTSGWTGAQQQWYLSQNIGQYFGHPISPSPQVSLPQRPEYGYHSSGVIVGQQPHPNAHYYYPPGASFAGQASQAHGQTIPGHYATRGTQLDATRSVQPQYGAHVAPDAGSVEPSNGKLMMFVHVFFERSILIVQ